MDQAIRVDHSLRENPAVEAIYRFEQKLPDLLRKKSQRDKPCRCYAKAFARMLAQLKSSAFDEIASLSHTFER